MKAKQRLNTRDGQRGQVLLWFLATVAASCAILALVYNVGQMANEKEKTVNAADASALSGALVEARILNFTAYTNRAMIANEVTIAQMLSADSWVRYDATLAQYMADYLQFLAVVPIIGTAIVDGLNAHAQALQYLKQVTDQTARIVILACDTANKALGVARKLALDGGPAAASTVANGIANANQTTFGGRFDTQPELNTPFAAAMAVINETEWLQFTKDFEGNDRGNAAGVILNSRDQFSKKRDNGWLISSLNTALEAGMLVASGFQSYAGFDKTSKTTELVDYDHWAAQDSLDPFVAQLQYCWGIPCGYEKVYVPLVPLAYGRADANNDGRVSKDLCHPAYSTFGTGTTTNCQDAVDDAYVISADGIPNIVDLANPGGPNTADPTLTFVAGVQKQADATLTTQRIGLNVPVDGPQGSPDLADNLQNGDRLTSIASAKVFFARPDWSQKDITQGNLPRPDHKHEYASLYNPYWQARLMPTDDLTKAGLYTAIGADPLLSLATP
jgi:Putative Flp pilus-assembly TadE/G-like